MYLGAALLIVGAVFVFVRGQAQVIPTDVDPFDEMLIDGDHLVEMQLQPVCARVAATTPVQTSEVCT